MPVSKVDSRCFNISQKIDAFLSLGNASRTNLTPPDFWKELVQSEEAVSSYIVCLIAKLISLDSEHGLKPLPNVYKDLVEMPVDHTKYKQWSAKPLPANCKSTALELQYAIITTIRHLKDCYGYAPNIHLRHMYLRWNLARNYAIDGETKADDIEEKVISPFSVAQSKEVIHSPLNSPLHKSLSPPPSQTGASPEDEELALVRRLVDECYSNHRRAFFGSLPQLQCKLCNYTNATDCLSYIRLRDLTSRSPRLLKEAMGHVLKMLNVEVLHSQSYDEKEVLLPLLHLFREFLTMMCPANTVELYRSIMPFYMWPITHSEYTRSVLDQIMQEGRIRGTSFRRRVLAEHDMGLKPSETKVRSQMIHMMVDISHPLTRGGLLHETFTTHQEKPDQTTIQRLIIRNIFKSVDPEFDVVELEGKLQHLSQESLKNFCLRAMNIGEKVSNSSSSEIPADFLKTEAEKLRKDIIQLAESDEQRDSAVSCSSIDTELRFTDDYLGSFPLPHPLIHSHPLNDTQYPTVLVKIREVLIMCRQKIFSRHDSSRKDDLSLSLGSNHNSKGVTVDVVKHKKPPLTNSSSHTSLDSTGSSFVDQDEISPDTDPKRKLSTDNIITNGHVTTGNDHVTNDKNHMINGDSHVNGQHSPDEITTEEKKRPTSLHCLDGNDNSSDQMNGKPPLVKQHSSDRISLTSEDRISESSLTQDISPATARRRNCVASRQLVRRQTCPSGMYAKRASVLNSPSSNAKRYTNASNQPTTVRSNSQSRLSGTIIGSNRVKMRRNSSAPNRSIKRKTSSRTSVVSNSGSSPSTKLVKILLAGNDSLVTHAAKAFAHLQMEEPNLLSGIELKFYHIPLSRASQLHKQYPRLTQGSWTGNQTQGIGDLPEPMFEQVDWSGNDIHLGRFLGHLDSWYERNVMMAIHHLLRLLPSDLPSSDSIAPIPEIIQRPLSPITDSLVTLGEATRASRTSLTPSKVLIEAVTNYSREANNCININMYRLKLNIKNEKTHKIEHREEYMLHRLDIQRLSGKKSANRQVKTFEANINMTQLKLDGSLIRSDMMEMKDVWLIRSSNVPRAGDSCVPNPESDCFELTITKALSEGGRFGATKLRGSEETQYHVCDMIIETRDKPFSVMVDSDTDLLLDNVVRLEVLPAFMEQSSSASTTRLNEQKVEKKLQFPLMTFWPVDL